MSRRVEELAFADTPIGEINLRRRRDPLSGVDVFEVKLGDEFLMSSLFVEAEEQVASLALARLASERLAVVVGGLGLGYTAQQVLRDPRVSSLVVVDYLQPIIDWHVAGLVPVGPVLTADARCRFLQGDFFALSDGAGFGEPVDAIVVDIDHSPQHQLSVGNEGFYSIPGTKRLARWLKTGGVYSLWSNDPPDQAYLDVLRAVFVDVEAVVVSFPNPLQDRVATNTVYLATKA